MNVYPSPLVTFICSIIFNFVILQVSLTQARIDMSELDEDSDGYLQPRVCPDSTFTLFSSSDSYFTGRKVSRGVGGLNAGNYEGVCCLLLFHLSAQ